MKVNSLTQIKTQTTVLPSNHQLQLTNIIKQLSQVNQAYVTFFNNNYEFKSDLLSRKHTIYLYNKISGELEHGITQIRNSKKEKLCAIFRNFIHQFIIVYIADPLSSCCNDTELATSLIEKWENFKRFCYFYYFLFKTAENHYETSYKSYKGAGKSNRIDNEDSIFPFSAIAIYFFQNLVMKKFKTEILRKIRHMLSQQRQSKPVQRQMLKSLIEIVYSSGLGQLARINSIKRQNNQFIFHFYATNNQQFVDHYTNMNKNPDQNFFTLILDDIIDDSSHYYSQLFHERIIWLGPHQDFLTVSNILLKQQEISQYYLFNARQKSTYLNKIKQIVVMTKLEERLCRENSLKYCLQRFDHNFQQYINQIKLIIDTVLKAKSQSIKILQNVIKEYLMESGQKINEKINKRRQHMIEIVNLKKSINRLIDQVMHKDLNICVVRDKCFKKLLDTIQASRNLSDFIDFKVKQCIKNKFGDSEVGQKIKDIFLILENLAATDSFLVYHQQLLARRLLEPLNEPKVQIEKLILKKIAQMLGSVTITSHSSMIKDLQRSQELSEKYNKMLPLARFKFSCRIISPQFWPDSSNNIPIEMILPEAVRLQAQSIIQLYNQQFSKFLVWKLQKGYSLFEGTFKDGKYRFQAENIFVMLLFHINEAKNKQMHFWQLLKKVIKMREGNSYIMKCVKALVDNGLITRSISDNQQPIDETELLKINANYKPAPAHKPNQTIMIKITSQMQKALHETTVQQNKILKQRQKLIEAVIVKILKHSHSTGTNRTTLEQIVKGVREYQHLRNFQIPQNSIKQRLEEVIARGFCQRDETNRKIYQYVA